jgi:hypothetical protein
MEEGLTESELVLVLAGSVPGAVVRAALKMWLLRVTGSRCIIMNGERVK